MTFVFSFFTKDSRINIQTDFLDLHGRLWLDTSEDYVFASRVRRREIALGLYYKWPLLTIMLHLLADRL